MSSWLISVPVWGDTYFRTFERVCAPALLVAVRLLREEVRVVLHTDADINRVRAALPGLRIEVRPVPKKTTYVTLQESHQDALNAAAPGEYVVFLNADLTISVNLLTRCAEHFAAGCKAVVLLGIRTEAGPKVPPAGADPRALLSWAWTRRHRIIRDLEWGTGRSMLPTNLFWSSGDSVVARGFHLHPVAVVKEADISFVSTIDGDLLDYFPREAIHVVTDPDDCSMCETSAPERRFPISSTIISPGSVAASMSSRASAMHRWLFDHRIVVCGGGAGCDDAAIAADILRRLGEPVRTTYKRGMPVLPGTRPERGPGSYRDRRRPHRA